MRKAGLPGDESSRSDSWKPPATVLYPGSLPRNRLSLGLGPFLLPAGRSSATRVLVLPTCSRPPRNPKWWTEVLPKWDPSSPRLFCYQPLHAPLAPFRSSRMKARRKVGEEGAEERNTSFFRRSPPPPVLAVNRPASHIRSDLRLARRQAPFAGPLHNWGARQWGAEIPDRRGKGRAAARGSAAESEGSRGSQKAQLGGRAGGQRKAGTWH